MQPGSLFSNALRLALSGILWTAAVGVVLSAVVATSPILLILFLINRPAFHRTLNFNKPASAAAA